MELTIPLKCTAQITIQGLFLLYPPPNSVFAQSISFRMFSSLEIFLWSLYGNTFDHSKERTNIEKKQRKKYPSEFVKLWHLYEKNNVRNPQPFSKLNTCWLRVGSMNFSWFLERFMSYFNLLLHNYMKKILQIMPKLQY